MELRSMTPTERMYTYRQSQQISMQTGLIGHLRADMDSNGTGFFSTWFGFRDDLKNDEFKAEFDEVINACRFDEQYDGILGTRDQMKTYCRIHPEAGFEGNYCTEYGFRADTEKFSYMMRLNPIKGDYNLYCYCYRRDWLDSHLKSAEKGIRFITPHYDEKFRIDDGDKIRTFFSDGTTEDFTCRYIDDYHLEVGSNLYHICEYAEHLENCNAKIVPLRSSLPDKCYTVLSGSKNIVILVRGESGYYRSDIPTFDKAEARKIVDECNDKLGVTKAQEEAMKAGSMFGFQCPAADPKNYDENGTPIRPKQKDRGDAR